MIAGARITRVLLLAATALSLAACGTLGFGGASKTGGSGRAAVPVVTDPAPIVSGTMRPYQIRGRWYRPEEQPNYDETGLASWYGDAFNGRPTSTGERFDMHAMTAAHKTLPLPGLVEVTNLANGRTMVLRVNDRGPFVEGRIIDLSRGAASELGMPPTRVKKLQAQARAWDSDSIAQAMVIVAGLNADVKGQAADADFALEDAVAKIAGLRPERSRR